MLSLIDRENLEKIVKQELIEGDGVIKSEPVLEPQPEDLEAATLEAYTGKEEEEGEEEEEEDTKEGAEVELGGLKRARNPKDGRFRHDGRPKKPRVIPLNCNYCRMQYGTKEDLVVHMREAHNYGQTVFCNGCNMVVDLSEDKASYFET